MNRNHTKIILASGSPRRKELLSQVGLTFTVDVTDGEEIIQTSDPAQAVQILSREKAARTAAHYSHNSLIIGADTVVAFNNSILGKPKDRAEAFQMLSALKNNWHSVFTGVTIIYVNEEGSRQQSFAVETRVKVMDMTDEEIHGYIETNEPMDKAGAYGIQGLFAEYVEGIEGDYNNVVGLPVARLLQEIKLL